MSCIPAIFYPSPISKSIHICLGRVWVEKTLPILLWLWGGGGILLLPTECPFYPYRIILYSSIDQRQIHWRLLVFWIPGYPGPPAPGPLQRPSFGLEENRRPKPSKEDPHEEVPHEENDGQTAKDQKTSSRDIPRAGKDHIHVSATHSSVGKEDKNGRWHTIHATPTRGRSAPAVPT
jgi:hypothetical protein